MIFDVNIASLGLGWVVPHLGCQMDWIWTWIFQKFRAVSRLVQFTMISDVKMIFWGLGGARPHLGSKMGWIWARGWIWGWI